MVARPKLSWKAGPQAALPPLTKGHIQKLLLLLQDGPSTQVYERVISPAASKLQMVLRCDQLPVGEQVTWRFEHNLIDDSCNGTKSE